MQNTFFRTAVSLLALMAAAPIAYAEQFVLFDTTFTFTKADADKRVRRNKSHYYVREPLLNVNRPVDWTSPLDYRMERSIYARK